jgi:hypothetical protein
VFIGKFEKSLGQQPLFMNQLPFSFVIPSRISCHAALDTVACVPFLARKGA